LAQGGRKLFALAPYKSDCSHKWAVQCGSGMLVDETNLKTTTLPE